MHLWEAQHSYYCSDSNYYVGGPDYGGLEFSSWPDFLAEFEDADLDMNLVFRWDWRLADADNEQESDTLYIYFILQRKGNFLPVRVNGVTKDDEKAVKAFLRPRWEHLRTLWDPLV